MTLMGTRELGLPERVPSAGELPERRALHERVVEQPAKPSGKGHSDSLAAADELRVGGVDQRDGLGFSALPDGEH